MAVDPLFAQWLQAPADYVVRTSASATARWGATAITPEGISPIALKADAQDQGDRELAFWSHGPFAIELHQVAGTDWAASIGRVVTLTIAQLGYDAGLDVWIFEVSADRATGLSDLTVLRPMA